MSGALHHWRDQLKLAQFTVLNLFQTLEKTAEVRKAAHLGTADRLLFAI